MEHSHKSGSLKQSNKSHKQVKASKRSNKMSSGGRVESVGQLSIKERTQSKKDRMNLQKQIRDNKRKEYLEKKKSGAGAAFPSVVALIPLNENVDTRVLMKEMINLSSDGPIRYSTLGSNGYGQPVTVVFPKYKSRSTFLCCSSNLEEILDAAKVADICLFLCDVRQGEEGVMSPSSDLLLTCLRSQGMPSAIGVIQGIREIANPKLQMSLKKYASRLLQTELGMDGKLFDDEHVDQLLRCISETPIKTLHWRQIHSYLLVDAVAVEHAHLGATSASLRVAGYVHGVPLALYDALHITGEGSHVIESVRECLDPSPLKQNHGESAIEKEPLVADRSRLPSLMEENPVQPDAVEEPHWPTPTMEMEMQGALTNEAIWREAVGEELYDDEEDRKAHEELEKVDEENALDSESDMNVDEEDFEDYEDFNRKHPHTKHMTEEERKEEQKEYLAYPDEVEIEGNQPARYRFVKYRGLQSFRNSPWDPKENLPIEYASIFQFDDTNLMQKSMMEMQEKKALAKEPFLGGENGEQQPLFAVGAYVEIVLSSVSLAWINQHVGSHPIILSSLLPHEEKYTVLHTTMQKSSSWYSNTLKSKDLLTVQLGFRRFLARPIFSNSNTRCSKKKFVKYVPDNDYFACSFYGPMTYRPTPMMLFSPRNGYEQNLQLVGMGDLTSASADDVILKKAVLTGTPFKVRRKLATVRHMFFDPKDILWFKPVELHTKLGCVGHIKEPLGVHGYMKCIFNEQLSMQDEVRMALYKRVYPKKVTEEEKSAFI